MNRRRFVLMSFVTACAGPSLPLGRVAAIPPVDAKPEDFREVMYRNSDPNGDYRSAFVRVCIWVDESAAIAHATSVVSDPGSDLPEGEFYQTEPIAITPPILPPGIDFGGWSWHTTVGVAAFVTGFAVIALRRETTTWDIVVVTGDEGTAIGLASDLAETCAGAELAPCGGLDSYLPGAAHFPEDLALEYSRTPNGMFDPEGTPVDQEPASEPEIPQLETSSTGTPACSP